MVINGEDFEGEFVVMIGEELLYFHNTSQIPDRFDHLIRFAPMCPPAPHNEETHDRIHQMNAKLQQLMAIERSNNASSNEDRRR